MRAVMAIVALAALVATVAILSGCGSGSGGSATAVGQVVNADKASATYVLQPLTSWSGFTPPGDSVRVTTDANTVFRDRAGNAMTSTQWYDYVAENASISTAAQASGSYGNGAISATLVQLQ